MLQIKIVALVLPIASPGASRPPTDVPDHERDATPRRIEGITVPKFSEQIQP